MKKSLLMIGACGAVTAIALGGWFFSDFWKETFSNRKTPEAAYWSARYGLRAQFKGRWLGFEKTPPTSKLSGDTTAEVVLEGAMIDAQGISTRHHWKIRMEYENGHWRARQTDDIVSADPAHWAPAYLRTQK